MSVEYDVRCAQIFFGNEGPSSILAMSVEQHREVRSDLFFWKLTGRILQGTDFDNDRWYLREMTIWIFQRSATRIFFNFGLVSSRLGFVSWDS